MDSKPYKGNGHIETALPLGSHNYIIAAEGYETIEGTFKLTTAAPRTVTEHLVATASPQQVVENSVDVIPSAPAADNGEPRRTIIVGNVQFTMIRVDGGTFLMGGTSEQGSDADSDEKPAHQVTLSSYYIGETEVTQELWRAVMGKKPSNFKGDRLPVESVSWRDCQSFIEKLNRQTGLRFRLPTEAEWEYAARGGNKSRGYKYSGSNNIGDVAWYDGNSSSSTHDVKTKQPNELGLYDMSGNVWEWCQDWYDSYSAGSQQNPTGASSGSLRVNRGGSWYFNAGYCRVSFRFNLAPGFRFDNLGLRLALQ